ncbi:IS5 family transposase [Actinospica sp. MGRD01-02]|uniref:IS5 family transposase n=1 Tax=Actinospica acidithermotolerans TaxID=2828514 RepID=A0A941E9E4_9ACTN|nr:IS5 family transposase [Actinospica acidithermotolerans]MBR7828695.1 IS5 family transposase [Actinospica acidithermotolerans]
MLEPLLPRGKRPGRPMVHNRRRLIDGIRWRTRAGPGRAGVAWRDVPPYYGPWQCVYWLYRRWQLDGVWSAILTALQAGADADGLITWNVSVDSTVTRAHQHAAGARRDPGAQAEPPVGEPADHGLGRSRGGLTSKLHVAIEQGQRLLALVLTAGQRGDSPQFAPCAASACPGGRGRAALEERAYLKLHAARYAVPVASSWS